MYGTVAAPPLQAATATTGLARSEDAAGTTAEDSRSRGTRLRGSATWRGASPLWVFELFELTNPQCSPTTFFDTRCYYAVHCTLSGYFEWCLKAEDCKSRTMLNSVEWSRRMLCGHLHAYDSYICIITTSTRISFRNTASKQTRILVRFLGTCGFRIPGSGSAAPGFQTTIVQTTAAEHEPSEFRHSTCAALRMRIFVISFNRKERTLADHRGGAFVTITYIPRNDTDSVKRTLANHGRY